jgi:hypothetical protein
MKRKSRFALIPHSRSTLVAALLVATGVALASSPAARADAVTNWNEVSSNVIVALAKRPVPAATVDFAYVHVAIYDAVAAIDGRFRPFAVTPSSPAAGASADAAVAGAAYGALLALFPSQKPYLDSELSAALALVPDGEAETKGLALGQEVAAAFLALRSGDGRNASVPYTPGSGPGAWQPTPPAFAAAVTPWVGAMQPFALLHAAQFRPSGPPALDSAEYAADLAEVQSYGALASTTRTAQQAVQARGYLEHGGSQYSRSLRWFALQRGLSLADNARFFAQVHVAMADAIIACWEAKYHYGFWRPITAIRAADTDGNAATTADAAWLPLSPTAPHPEYPSGHSTATGAMAETLRLFFGTPNVAFDWTSSTTGTTTRYENTNQVIKAVVDARVWIGFHFRRSDVHGRVLGQRVARWVAQNYFQPK